ncbi:hypothetical protein [Bradyrhizobium glycinis]|uniref:hypothetical protein n=1 Tax=Bradyrhizobium glycinis TaxID=2751812 RepID=UPI0018DA221D|nr:hypothetical protein [Bradyrhizobium glycinis]MBH5371417.1 hypothetical protein [Bradyrhizobium glycinis]
MKALATLGVLVVFLMVLGNWLDKQHLEVTTIEKIRTRLISFYLWLYDAPSRLKKGCQPIISWFNRMHEPPAFDIRTGQSIKQRPPVARYALQLTTAVAVPIFMMQFHHFDPDTPVSSMNLPSETAWWWAILAGIVVALVGPIFFLASVGLWACIITLPSLILLALIEMMRRSLLLVLNKSTSPRTSPFTYFSGLASVFLSGGESARQLFVLWW